MIIKEAKYKKVKKLVTVMVSSEVYGCDNCKKEIDPEKDDLLSSTVFYHNDETKRLQHCSWKCVIKGLKKEKTDYFIDLPYLSFDHKRKGTHVADFFKLFDKK